MKKALAILLAAAMCVPVVALSACKDGVDGKDGKDGVNGINGIDGTNGTNGSNGSDGKDGSDGKSAYELYVEYNPDYKGSEQQWLEDLAAGKLKNEYNHNIISYGKLVNGAPSAGTATAGTSELALSGCVVKLAQPVIVPVNSGAEWEINFGGKINGSAGVQLLTSSPEVVNGRIYFAANASQNKMYLGAAIDGTYFNYCWEVPAATINGSHEYKVSYKGGVYYLSIDGGAPATFKSVNHNQSDSVTITSPKTASNDLNDKIKAITGQEYFTFTSLGASGFACNGSLAYLDIKTSSVYGYESLSAHPLYGKKIYHLGSSISYGSANGGKSFAEMISALTGSEYKKETVSGTTLSSSVDNSYVQRFPNLDVETNKPDFLTLQLSTNDFTRGGITLGTVGTETDSQKLNAQTTAGAMEYIIAETKDLSPKTKVVIYTCSVSPTWGARDAYKGFINIELKKIQAKWDNVIVVDLFNKDAVYTGWMDDAIHPKGHEYANLFVPEMINVMTASLDKN